MLKSRQTKIRSLVVKFSPDHMIGRHTHPWLQLLYATSGVMVVQTDAQTWMVPSQRAVWIPAGIPHQITMRGVVTMTTLYFHPNLKVFDGDLCLAVNVSRLMRELIIHACDRGIIECTSFSNRSFVQFLVEQAQKMEGQPLELSLPVDPRARQVAEQILLDASQPLTVLASGCGVSLRTLQRIFRQETGLSLGRWRQHARLYAALPLLASGRKVTAVALDLGYESLSAFVSAFRKFFGVTPAKYFQSGST